MKDNQDFNALPIPKKDVAKAGPNRYRVYSDDKKFVVVDAENARAALIASGIKQAARIEREGLYIANVIHLNEAAPDIKNAAAPAAEATPAAAEAPKEASS